MDIHHQSRARRSRIAWSTNLLLFLAVAALLLVSERAVRAVGIWPTLLLLACAGSHFFMHGSHGRHHHGGAEEGDRDADR